MRLGALLVLFLAFQAYWFLHETRTEARLGGVAGEIAGREVGVRCPSVWRRLVDVSNVDGSVEYDGHGRSEFARLSHRVCKTFARLEEDAFAELPLDVVIAVHVLTHEAYHLAGVRNEAAADCYALQTNARTARLLGATEAQAARLAAQAVHMRAVTAPAGYRSSECRPGGRLWLVSGDGGRRG